MRNLRSVVLMGALSLLGGALVSCGADAAPGAEKKPSPPAAAPDKTKSGPLFGQWHAIGSGCRAQHDKPGDVTFQAAGGDASKGDSLRGVFKLGAYKLTSPPENPKTSMTFARECSIRIALNPPPGKRIKSASAQTRILFSKAAGVDLQIQNLLYLGGERVGGHLVEVPAAEAVNNREEAVELVSGRFPQGQAEAFKPPELKCGQSTLLGVDYTFIAGRKNPADSASVRLTGDRTLAFSVALEDCKPN